MIPAIRKFLLTGHLFFCSDCFGFSQTHLFQPGYFPSQNFWNRGEGINGGSPLKLINGGCHKFAFLKQIAEHPKLKNIAQFAISIVHGIRILGREQYFFNLTHCWYFTEAFTFEQSCKNKRKNWKLWKVATPIDFGENKF